MCDKQSPNTQKINTHKSVMQNVDLLWVSEKKVYKHNTSRVVKQNGFWIFWSKTVKRIPTVRRNAIQFMWQAMSANSNESRTVDTAHILHIRITQANTQLFDNTSENRLTTKINSFYALYAFYEKFMHYFVNNWIFFKQIT